MEAAQALVGERRSRKMVAVLEVMVETPRRGPPQHPRWYVEALNVECNPITGTHLRGDVSVKGVTTG
jgi:hypothetical protein